MAKNPSHMDADFDDGDVIDPKSQRRPLQQGESVPPIPTMVEQMAMAWAAGTKAAAPRR
jgi:hypothetical protein